MNLEKLVQDIIRHKNLYYSGKAEIDDHEYDQLEEKLRKIDPDHPVLHMVGSSVSTNKVKHNKKMLSLGKTYSSGELEAWMNKSPSISSYKIDGSSCSLIYRNGKLVQAKTRGDGKFGEDITTKIWFIENIPKKLNSKIDLEVRGEIYCHENKFINLIHEMSERNLDKPTSQRNIVAGLLGRKENIDLSKYLDFSAFEVFGEKEFDSEMEKLDFLSKNNFLIPEYTFFNKSEGLDEYLEQTKDFMSNGPFMIDGLVFTYNDLSLHEELGYTAHHPRYKLAFKFQGESKATIINNIEWNVSRNGVLTPVAIVEPTSISGATINRVTLHNYGLVNEFQLKKGDQIEIVRSGEVIPKFMGVLKSSKNIFQRPEKCPSCGKKITVVDIRLICNNKCCPDKIKDEILNFIRKIGIDDLSDKRLAEMIKIGLVTDVSSLYDLSVDKLLTLDKTKEKMANKIYKNIQTSKKTTLLKFLSSLGIQGGAVNKNERIINSGYDSIEKLKKMNVSDLEQIPGFAIKSSTDYINSLNNKWSLIDELLAKGFEFTVIKQNTSDSLKDLNICITGSLSRKRSEIQKDIKQNGGKAQSSVTGNTNFLVCNDISVTSSKTTKAQELNIPIINEKELYNKMEG